MSLLLWNVRGLGQTPKRRLVKDTITQAKYTVICFRETKLSNVTKAHVASSGDQSLDSWDVVDANGSSGGLLTAWNSSQVDGLPFSKGEYSLSTLHRFRQPLMNQTQ